MCMAGVYTILGLFSKAEYFISIRQDPVANTKNVFLKQNREPN